MPKAHLAATSVTPACIRATDRRAHHQHLDTLKVLADPLRGSILEHLRQPRTVKQLTTALGLATIKLYYHVNLLERHGLMGVVGTRHVAAMTEKRYQVTARTFRVAHALLTPSVLDITKRDIAESMRAGWSTASRSCHLALKKGGSSAILVKRGPK